ncbi:MAG: ComEC/Rec2 family competence protein [Labilithrix sp.]|nr:ComEC/Rec2 family competence protein [Labilithrix sp.]MCW5810732.1 ComEC/Rec2 family competence protein [Labilithrix sp.]
MKDAVLWLGLALCGGALGLVAPLETACAALAIAILLRRRRWLVALAAVALAIGYGRAALTLRRFEAARADVVAEGGWPTRCTFAGHVARSPALIGGGYRIIVDADRLDCHGEKRPAASAPERPARRLAPHDAGATGDGAELQLAPHDAAAAGDGAGRRDTRLALHVDADAMVVPGRGDRVEGIASLAPPYRFWNDGVGDPRPASARRGVLLSGGAEDLVVATRGFGAGALVDRARVRLRARIVATFPADTAPMARALVLGEDDLADVDARAFRRSGLAHLLAVSGMHLVLVVMGFVALLRAALLRVPAIAERGDVMRVAAAVGIPCAWLYADLAGGSGSAIRAAWMCTVVLLARALGRRTEPWRALGLSLVAMSIADPLAAFDVSFVLSALATGGLLALARPIEACIAQRRGLCPRHPHPRHGPRAEREGRFATAFAAASGARLGEGTGDGGARGGDTWGDTWGGDARGDTWGGDARSGDARSGDARGDTWGGDARSGDARGDTWGGDASERGAWGARVLGRVLGIVAKPLAATVGATVACAPVLATIAPELALGGLVANLVAVPIGEAAALPLCLLHALLGGWADAERGCALAASGALVLVRLVAHCFTWATVPIPAPTAAQLAVCAVAAAAAALAARPRRWLGAAAVSLVALELLVRARGAPIGVLRATYIDVGQGDAALVDLPDGSALLIDGGGLVGSPIDVGERAVGALLEARRRRRLAAVILSHPHPDHFLGLTAALAHATPETFWDTGQGEDEGTGGAYAELLRELRARGVPVLGPRALCGVRRLGGAVVEVLAPCPSLAPDRGANDNSFVVRIRYGERALLFAGDAEHTEEEELVRGGVDLRADVLKVGHHGSRTSSTPAFLARVAPEVAIVSCGVRNRFGHPHGEALTNLDAARIRVLRTDQEGSVVVTTDGRSLDVRAQFRSTTPMNGRLR